MLQYLGELHTKDNKVNKKNKIIITEGLDKKESTKKEEKQKREREKKKGWGRWTMKKLPSAGLNPITITGFIKKHRGNRNYQVGKLQFTTERIM